MYSQPITQSHRSTIVFCIDCSTSMQEEIIFNNQRFSKADLAALFANIMIDELYIRSSRYGNIRNYYDIAVIGYGGDGAFPMLCSKNIALIPITELSKATPKEQIFSFTQEVNGKTHMASFIVHPWIKPTAQGQTPMYEALVATHSLISAWCSKRDNKRSFPPMVFNITDGEATDGSPADLINIAHNIKNTGTRDGNTLMINVHIGDLSEGNAILFPRTLYGITESRSAHTLYHMSSIAPRNMEPLLPPDLSTGTVLPRRLMAHNTTPYDLLNIIHIGSESLHKM